MKKKGFTLTELLAVVAVIVIIVLAATASFVGIRRSVLKRDYNNLVMYIETQASKYAEVTGITTINVEGLIKEGYIDPDDETDIYNPIDKTSLNCNIVNMTYENGSYNAKMEEESTLSEDKKSCGTYGITSDYNIYVITPIVDNERNCNQDEINGWYNCDVELGVKDKNNNVIDTSTATIEWYGNSINGIMGTTIKTNTYELSQSSYRVKVTMSDDLKIGGATKIINIDKQAPVVNEEKIENENIWVSKEVGKKVRIEATDYDGAGIDGYYLGTNNNCNEVDYSENKELIIKDDKDYYVCVKDKVGNISEAYQIKKVEKLDSIPIKPEIKSNDNVESGASHTGEKDPFTLTFTSGYNEGEIGSDIHFEYRIGEDGERIKMATSNNSVQVGMDAGVVTYYVWACNETICNEDYETYEVVTQITVTFDANGGVVNPNSKIVIYNQNYGDLPTPSKVGNVFSNWYLENTYSTLIQNNTKVTTLKNHNLYAKWTPNTYTINYNLNSGSNGTYHPTRATYDEVVRISNPTRTGYTFAGWTITSGLNSSTAKYGTSENDVNNAISSNSIKVNAEYLKNITPTNNGSVTLTANWTANTYTINYNANGGSGSMSSTICIYDSNCTLRSNSFTMTGYTFSNWKNASGNTYSNGQSVRNLATSGTVTLNAQWTLNTYTINYNLNSGSYGTYHPTSGTYDTAVRISNPTRTGYTFAGWTVTSGLNTSTAKYGSSSNNINNSLTSSSTKVLNEYFKNLTITNNGNVTLTANWTANTYTINYNANGGSGSMSSTTCTYDSNCTLRSNSFTNGSYVFNGWTYSGNTYSNGQSVRNLATSGTITLYANWISPFSGSISISTSSINSATISASATQRGYYIMVAQGNYSSSNFPLSSTSYYVSGTSSNRNITVYSSNVYTIALVYNNDRSSMVIKKIYPYYFSTSSSNTSGTATDYSYVSGISYSGTYYAYPNKNISVSYSSSRFNYSVSKSRYTDYYYQAGSCRSGNYTCNSGDTRSGQTCYTTTRTLKGSNRVGYACDGYKSYTTTNNTSTISCGSCIKDAVPQNSPICPGSGGYVTWYAYCICSSTYTARYTCNYWNPDTYTYYYDYFTIALLN